ncbi:cytochrome P450 [Pendulispora brunnea]|uniref:Cytochrome P450 n=1 Tax=Pendulispora brunnea TaxID=2905690 RepID=A0ABZ2KLC8_9BACT
MKISVPREPLEVDLDAIDLFDPELYASGDPHPLWKALRQRAPIHRQTLRDGRFFWSVTKYDDANDVLRDHTRFTSQRGTLLCILGQDDPASGKMMAATDPPRHGAMREPLMKMLSHRSLNERKPQIRRIVHRLLAPLADGATWDIAEAGANFPMAFTGTLMGLPEADWPRLTRLTTMAIAPDDSEFQEGSSRATLAASHHELFEYFSDEVHRRDGSRDRDLIDFLIRMEAGGERLRHDEIVYNCYSLLLGANVTTPHAIATTVQAFIEHPGEYRRLLERPALVPSAVEEGLRWASPANHFMRYAVRDLTLRGVSIQRGDALAVWLGSANRDEDAFPDPYRFDVGRTPNRHIAFGFGPHYCIGAPLARIALNLLFEEIVRVVEAFEGRGPAVHLKSNFVAGLKHLPVAARLRAGAAELLESA